MNQKIAALAWTVDPENNKRYLLRHNKPFNGYEDEWTITFGDVEENESIETAAMREIEEEFNIIKEDILEVRNLNYKTKYFSKKRNSEIVVNYFAIKVKDLNIKIILNGESIGYDWMKLDKAKESMQYEDERAILEMV